MQIFHSPVVIHDLQLIMREKYGQHPVRFLRLTGLAAVARNGGGGGGAVMPVGDIQRVNLREFVFQFFNLRGIGYHPGGVDHAVFGGKIIFRLSGNNLFHNRVNAGDAPCS